MLSLLLPEARRGMTRRQEEAYLRFLRIWQSFDPEVVPVARRRLRIRRPVDERFEHGPERYPAGGGYRIVRQPKMFEDD